MKKTLLIFLLAVLTLSGCTTQYLAKAKSPVYTGRDLEIGIIGKKPRVKEGNVKFTTISFEKLEDTKSISKSFDAVFIMQKHLKQADKEKYVNTYKELSIPIFFVQTTKGFLPFVVEGMSYKDAPDISDSYIAGYMQKTKDQYINWGFGLENGVENGSSVNEIYIRVLKTIETLAK